MATKESVTAPRARGRFITFPGAIDTWLDTEWESRGHRNVNELVIDIVREFWKQNQPQPESEQAA